MKIFKNKTRFYYFPDTEEFKDESEPTVSDITVSSLPIKGKRGRPKKTVVKTEKKAKISKVEEKPKSSKAVAKGRFLLFL